MSYGKNHDHGLFFSSVREVLEADRKQGVTNTALTAASIYHTIERRGLRITLASTAENAVALTTEVAELRRQLTAAQTARDAAEADAQATARQRDSALANIDKVRAAVGEVLERAEKAEAQVAQYDNTIAWETTCTICARFLDRMRGVEEAAEQAAQDHTQTTDTLKAKVEQLEADARDLDDLITTERAQHERHIEIVDRIRDLHAPTHQQRWVPCPEHANLAEDTTRRCAMCAYRAVLVCKAGCGDIPCPTMQAIADDAQPGRVSVARDDLRVIITPAYTIRGLQQAQKALARLCKAAGIDAPWTIDGTMITIPRDLYDKLVLCAEYLAAQEYNLGPRKSAREAMRQIQSGAVL